MADIPAPKNVKAKSKKGPPPPPQEVTDNLQKPDSGDMVPLNFRVPPDFRREFKSYAVAHDMSMVELLKRAFDKYRNS
ncbi:MAG: hypothetical protein KDJ99_16085 [Candidatus Competibacteraceae bacterium]|jgi:hypothetical protein|nr:hypothetical protein [Candidatus Competibacteraceae bacterium]